MTSIKAIQIQASTKSAIAALITIILLFALIIAAESAYQIDRPINYGTINQTYLWAEEIPHPINPGEVLQHKGVDFAANGTLVFSAADGLVVNLREDIANNQYGGSAYGNFVLIRHYQRHWDQSNNALSFVYSMYLHLSQGSVLPQVGDQVSAGDLIGMSGNTGNSFGPHLHFQIVLYPLQDRTLWEIDNLESGSRSRNPESWLTPLTGKSTAIGKVSDTSGNPVGNLVVCGIQKGAPTTGYVSSRTYSFPWANPDGILHENFGTTDVNIVPGTYFLYANDRAFGCNHSPHFADLGDHTFFEDQVTYVGLHPSWLPTVRPSSGTIWDAQSSSEITRRFIIIKATQVLSPEAH